MQGKPPTSHWTEAKEARLRDLWTQRPAVSLPAIAAALQAEFGVALDKNAVSQKRRAMRLPARTVQDRSRNGPPPKQDKPSPSPHRTNRAAIASRPVRPAAGTGAVLTAPIPGGPREAAGADQPGARRRLVACDDAVPAAPSGQDAICGPLEAILGRLDGVSAPRHPEKPSGLSVAPLALAAVPMSAHGCRWLGGDPARSIPPYPEKGWRYCDAPRVTRAWCACHAAVALRGWPAAEEVAA